MKSRVCVCLSVCTQQTQQMHRSIEICSNFCFVCKYKMTGGDVISAISISSIISFCLCNKCLLYGNTSNKINTHSFMWLDYSFRISIYIVEWHRNFDWHLHFYLMFFFVFTIFAYNKFKKNNNNNDNIVWLFGLPSENRCFRFNWKKKICINKICNGLLVSSIEMTFSTCCNAFYSSRHC